jgi:hypothetical protein
MFDDPGWRRIGLLFKQLLALVVDVPDAVAKRLNVFVDAKDLQHDYHTLNKTISESRIFNKDLEEIIQAVMRRKGPLVTLTVDTEFPLGDSDVALSDEFMAHVQRCIQKGEDALWRSRDALLAAHHRRVVDKIAEFDKWARGDIENPRQYWHGDVISPSSDTLDDLVAKFQASHKHVSAKTLCEAIDMCTQLQQDAEKIGKLFMVTVTTEGLQECFITLVVTKMQACIMRTVEKRTPDAPPAHCRAVVRAELNEAGKKMGQVPLNFKEHVPTALAEWIERAILGKRRRQ